MPIYEYECKNCGARFDKLIRNLENPPEIVCPTCEGMDVQRLISQVAVHGGEGGNIDADVAEAAADTESSKPPVFGRKELKAAQEKKRQWREEAKYGD
jgi:putative FmdB family regulatory protein